MAGGTAGCSCETTTGRSDSGSPQLTSVGQPTSQPFEQGSKLLKVTFFFTET
ncbi:hypothetical protein AVEN_16077-1, partial [Araneus ventricosus]